MEPARPPHGGHAGWLLAHLERQRGRAKIAVWAHNSHFVHARVAEMSRRGELNGGQLARDKYGRDAVLIGFTTHRGPDTAASDWDGPAERKRVRPALPGSYEALFHAARAGRFPLTWRAGDSLREPQLERAIGVVYRRETERVSHYFGARLREQFDAWSTSMRRGGRTARGNRRVGDGRAAGCSPSASERPIETSPAPKAAVAPAPALSGFWEGTTSMQGALQCEGKSVRSASSGAR